MDNVFTAMAGNFSDASKQKTKIISGFGGCPNGGSTAAIVVASSDCDRRRDPVDAFRGPFFSTIKNLAGLGGETLDITTWPFRIESV